MSSSLPTEQCILSPGDCREIFPFLEEKEARLLGGYGYCREYPVDSIVIREGERSEWMGFLLQGKVKVKKETVFPGKFVLVAILERGALVGELSAIDGAERSATVEVSEHCKILHLSTKKIELILDEHPLLGLKFLKWIIHIAGIRVRRAVDRLAKLL